MSSVYSPPILDFENVSFSYDRKEAFISRLSLSLGEGEFVGLLGANGSGKSTILKLGGGILKPGQGCVQLWGKSLASYNSRDRAKLISYLPQTLDISIPFTVRELVGMGFYPYDIPPVLTAEAALEMVGMADKSGARLSDLSGGERRRAFIAMTLLQGAGVLLLDEPLANLDIRYQIELVKLLSRLRADRNISVLMALHDINMALQFEKVLVIKKGKLLGAGNPRDILSAEMIREAFEVSLEVVSPPGGKAYMVLP